MVWEEAEIVVERLNGDAVSNTTLLHAALLGANSKKGAQALKKMLKELSNG